MRESATYEAPTSVGHAPRAPKCRSRMDAVVNAAEACPDGNAQHSPVGRSRRATYLMACVNACDTIRPRIRSKPRCDSLFVLGASVAAGVMKRPMTYNPTATPACVYTAPRYLPSLKKLSAAFDPGA